MVVEKTCAVVGALTVMVRRSSCMDSAEGHTQVTLKSRSRPAR
jgi:hypothetical protein